jgi:hypothetical protein
MPNDVISCNEPPGLRYLPAFAGFAEKNEIAGRSDADTLVEWRDFASGAVANDVRFRPLASTAPLPLEHVVGQDGRQKPGKSIACCGIRTGLKSC